MYGLKMIEYNDLPFSPLFFLYAGYLENGIELKIGLIHFFEIVHQLSVNKISKWKSIQCNKLTYLNT